MTINGTKYTWQVFTFNPRVTTYCADGDGIIEVRVRNGVFGLYDQNERVRSFNASTIADALRSAEQYADAVYNGMLEQYTI